MSSTVNVDFIGVVSLTDSGFLEYKRLPITKLFEEEMQVLESMSNNENRTVLDLQDYFQRFFPKKYSPQVYDYCAPHGYNSSFINRAQYPKIYTYDEYKSKLQEAEDRKIQSFLSDCDVKHVSDLSISQKTDLESQISKVREIEKNRLRVDFARSASRYVDAHRYYSDLKKVKADDNNKMYSTENVGWTTFEYPISKDVLFFMKSNFGYGRSSYHFINLSYKGIDILPYSALVKYYYVSMGEFYRYTRQYRPTHENWEIALDFVVETANLAIRDEKEFVTKWIANEIQEMIDGLKIISEQPKKSLKEILDNPKDTDKFLFIRNAYDSDKQEYEAFPEELSTIYKAEKLSAALCLLEKLQVLAPIHSIAQDAINKIKELNITFYPHLKEHIALIEKEIQRRQNILEPKIEERDRLKAKGKHHFDKMAELIEEERKKGYYNSAVIRARYLSTHPDFKELYEDLEKRDEEIQKDEYQISIRKNFVQRLDDCKNMMARELELAA